MQKCGYDNEKEWKLAKNNISPTFELMSAQDTSMHFTKKKQKKTL